MRVLRILGALALVQGVLVGAYLLLNSIRAEAPVPFVWERLDTAAPSLDLTRAGEPHTGPQALTLVHFWATWCVPCRKELPGLLEAAEVSGVPLLAVTDESWPVVERYFGGEVPAAVVRDATGDGTVTWQVSGLPDTFVVRRGQVIARMGGPRDWTTTEARRFLSNLETP